MKYKYPHYYKNFKCIAQDCEATCCAGWEIVIDDDSIENYLNLKTDFGNRLCNSIDFEEGIFHQDHQKRCAFLNEENLCDIYVELGEEALCYTCTQYPRHIEEFEELNEVSLSISCPIVAKMILDCEEKITFYEEEAEEEAETYEEFDYLFYEMLYEAREIIFAILQNRTVSIDSRMELVKAFSREIQDKINGYDTFAIDEVICKYEEFYKNNYAPPMSSVEKRYKQIQEYFINLYQLEVLQEDWRPYLFACQTCLYEGGYEVYQEQKKGFMNKYGGTSELMKEQLMVYFVYSYFCGAVYDGEVYAKHQLAYVTTRIIEELWLAQYIENKGALSKEDMCRIVYRYAREIEHSDQNLEVLEELLNGYE